MEYVFGICRDLSVGRATIKFTNSFSFKLQIKCIQTN